MNKALYNQFIVLLTSRLLQTNKLDMCDDQTLLLHDVLFAPKIRRNIVSVVVLFRFEFTLNMCSTSIKLYLDHVCYGYEYVSNGFIILDVVNIMTSYNTYFSLIAYVNDNIDVNVWHMRLGHIGQQMMDRLAKEGLLGHLERVSLPTCENYLKGKMTKKSFGTRTRSQFSLQLIHSYICEPMNVRARYGGRYFITFIDDYT
jgi:GAG-pre-integrase domain